MPIKINESVKEILHLVRRCPDPAGKLLLYYYRGDDAGKRYYMESIASRMVHQGLMEKLSEVMPPAIVYKGFWTATLYERPELRFISDVDLLMRWEDYLKGIEILESMGFQKYSDIPHSLPAWIRKHLEWETSMRKGLAMVELHLRPFPPYFLEIDMEHVFQSAHPWFGNFLHLDVEYNLFLNVLHFYKSTRRGIFHIIDALILRERADERKLREILRIQNVDEDRFFHVLDRMIRCEFPMESPFWKHGFYFSRNPLKSWMKFVIVKGIKRIYGLSKRGVIQFKDIG